MSETDATLFHGDGWEGENPQDFLNKVEHGFNGQVLSKRDKVNRCKLWLKSGSEVKEWFMSLGNEDRASWSQFVLAFELHWPQEVITWKSMAVRGLPIPPVPPNFFLSPPITFYSSAIISNLARSLPTLHDLSHQQYSIADHRRRLHSLAQHRLA
jgi:hypothetical protein